jgi:anaerobic magnesium-protoporphyrin IX monomethyl ester cyclase
LADILLIQPPIRDFYLTAKRTIPYGLACIAAVLLAQGFSVNIFDGLATSRSRIIDLPEEMTSVRKYYGRPDRSPFGLFYHYRHYGYSFEHAGRVARDSGAFLVGISALFTPYLQEALRVAGAVKRYHPACKIVIGGHHPTALPLSAIAYPAIDFVLRGEGEVSMPLLAHALKTGDSLASVPGIVFRKPDGTIHVDDPACMADPDRFSLPASHLIKHRFYQRKNKGSAVIVASRGCPLKCTYCSVGGASWLPYRRRTTASVIGEIETAVHQWNAGFIDFEDENLSFDKKWFLDLLHQIQRRFKGSPPELRAMNGLLPSSLDDETVCAMQAAGFKSLNLSLGSTSRARLDRFNRPDVREAFDRVLDMAEKYGLTAVGYVIAAAPGQSARESLSDLLFLAERRVLAAVSIFYPVPGSRDYDLCESLGILPGTFATMRSSALPLSHTTTRKEAATLLRLGRILNFMKYLKDQETGDGGDSSRHTGARDPGRRVETGRQLLDMFLADGRIRGITPDGEIFEHCVSTGLTRTFIRELKNIRMRGTR